MAGFFKDILLYPLIIIQMVLVGPFLWSANNNDFNGKGKQSASNAKQSMANSKSKQRSNQPTQHNPLNPESKSLKDRRDGHNAVKTEQMRRASAQTQANETIPTTNVSMEMGNIEFYTRHWSNQASVRYQNIISNAKQYFADTRASNTKVGKVVTKIGKKIGAHTLGYGSETSKKYYIKQGRFFSEAAKSYMTLEMGNPAPIFIAQKETQQAINKRYDQLVTNMVNSGGTGNITGTRQLREMMGNMYKQAAQEVVQATLNIDAKEYKKAYKHIVDGAVKNIEGSLTRSAKAAIGDFFSLNQTRHKKGLKNKTIKAINSSVVFKSLKLWPLETFYFNMAIIASSAFLANFYDSTFNPLYKKENRETRHHGFNPLGFIGDDVRFPGIEAMEPGFLGFILGNQAFQKFSTYTRIPQFMRGYMGMGVGSVVSSTISQVMMNPAWTAYNAAGKNYKAMMDEADKHPAGSNEKLQALESAKMWKTISNNAYSVVSYDLMNSKFWKEQVDHVMNLIGASIAAAGVGGLTKQITGFAASKITKGRIDNLAQWNAGRKEMVNAGKVKPNGLLNRTAQVAQGGPFLKKAFMQPAALIMFAAKDMAKGMVSLLFANPVMKLVHFAVFLVMDPVVRPMITPLTKQDRANDAYTKLAQARTYINEKRKKMGEGIWLDRINMDIFEGKDENGKLKSWYSYDRIFNSGSYQDSAGMFWAFKDYYDAKIGYRNKQLEAISLKHMNWKTYLEKFMTGATVAETMYQSLEDQLLTARSYKDQGYYPKGLIKKDMLNTFDYTTYGALHKETKSIVLPVLLDSLEEPNKKPYGFDESNLRVWQAEMYEADSESTQGGMIDKLIFSGKYTPEVHGEEKVSYPNQSSELYITFRNGAAEKILWGMMFGPDVRDEKIFDANYGDYPQYNYPRIIRKLPYNPMGLENLQIDNKDVYLNDTYMPNANSEKMVMQYLVPFTKVKFLDPDDGVYKNVFQMINDRALPKFNLGLTDSDDDISVSEYLNANSNCFPGKPDVSRPYIVTEGRQLITQAEFLAMDDAARKEVVACSDNSIYGQFQVYESLFADLIRNDVSQILTRTSHQAHTKLNSVLRTFIKFSPPAQVISKLHSGNWISDENPLGLMKASDSHQDALAKVDFSNLETGNENIYLSMMEDIIAAGGFLQTALPKASDYDRKEQADLYNRANALEQQDRGKGINAATAKLVNNYLDMLLETSTSNFFMTRTSYDETVNQLEEDFNKAMCYLNNRPIELDTKNPKASGPVEIGGTRYYKRYDSKKAVHFFTRIGKNSFCDVDQIASKIDVTTVTSEEVERMQDDETEFTMAHWLRNISLPGKDPILPGEASPEKLREYFDLPQGDTEEFQVALTDKIMEFLFIDDKQFYSKEDRSEVRKVAERLRESIELTIDDKLEEERQRNELVYYANPDQIPFLEEKKAIEADLKIAKEDVVIRTNRRIRPYMSLRTAIASKAISMMRRIMNEEAGQYQPYLLSMYKYAPNEYDSIAGHLCDVRDATGRTYSILSGQPPMQTLDSSACKMIYDKMDLAYDGPGSDMDNRKLENQQLEDRHKSVFETGFSIRKWWVDLFN